MDKLFSSRPRPVILCILDGWGSSENYQDNAIAQAKTPFWDYLMSSSPHSHLSTSGIDVGLPPGQMGNSEVGHMTIGSGRIIMQDLPRINAAVSSGDLANNNILKQFIDSLRDTNGICHLLGLLSDGGVHSHNLHIYALAKILANNGIKTYLHAFMDGRDVLPGTGIDFIRQFNAEFQGNNLVSIATISGRYYAMDRDKRWERTELAYQAIVSAIGENAEDAIAAMQNSYHRGESDEFIRPNVIAGYSGMRDNDGVIVANFRSDRVRQILAALIDDQFTGFARKKYYKLNALTMTEYSERLSELANPIFRAEKINDTLAQVIAERGLTQLRIAETEKYAHVTFFFNCGREEQFPGEERILIPSPKVATYDLLPEMSAFQITKEIVKLILEQKFDFIVVNYANPDMVGHTGNMSATIKAIEVIDSCLRDVVNASNQVGGVTIITADHGNAEAMIDHETQKMNTAHSTNPVPFVLVGNGFVKDSIKLQNGGLYDIAPSILSIMGLPQPDSMAGKSLIQENK